MLLHKAGHDLLHRAGLALALLIAIPDRLKGIVIILLCEIGALPANRGSGLDAIASIFHHLQPRVPCSEETFPRYPRLLGTGSKVKVIGRMPFTGDHSSDDAGDGILFIPVVDLTGPKSVDGVHDIVAGPMVLYSGNGACFVELGIVRCEDCGQFSCGCIVHLILFSVFVFVGEGGGIIGYTFSLPLHL